uniref:RNase H type-1 domain-containing protein n=1 Tax=Solanum tuberosum TaxID=4113 RepID=M1DIX2_SOLTU
MQTTGIGTNNQAKSQVALRGLHWCVQHGYMKVILEVDSELLTKWLNNNAKTPWKIQHTINELRNTAGPLEFFRYTQSYSSKNCYITTEDNYVKPGAQILPPTRIIPQPYKEKRKTNNARQHIGQLPEEHQSSQQ